MIKVKHKETGEIFWCETSELKRLLARSNRINLTIDTYKKNEGQVMVVDLVEVER